MAKNAQSRKRWVSTVVAAVVCLAAVAGVLWFPADGLGSPRVDLSEYATVNAICELATLKSYYHNVAMYEKKPGGKDAFLNDVLFWPFGNLTKTGYKQYWLEYSGIVETGIDVGKVQIGKPNAKGVVDVYVPDAVVLNVYADEDTLSEPITEKGLFTKITGVEQAEAFAQAQSKMRQEAEGDQALLRKAKNNAKLLLEQYIVNTGREMGADYSVNWVDHPL